MAALQAGWYGNKQLGAYRAQKDPRERLRACRAALEPSSVSPATMEELQSHAADGRLVIMDGTTVTGACRLPDGRLKVSCRAAAGAKLQEALDAMSMTSANCSTSTKGVSSGSGEASGLEAHDFGLAATHVQQGTADAPDDKNGAAEVLEADSFVVDISWAASGSAYNAMADPVLQQLHQLCPTRIVGGYPVLEDESLAWPGLGVHFLGRSTRLSMGPAAGSAPPGA